MGDAVVMADSGLLERVLANLIDNALAAALKRQGHRVTLVVPQPAYR